VDIRFAPNHRIKQGAKLVWSSEDVIEELPMEIRGGLFPVEATTSAQRASLLESSPVQKKILSLLDTDGSIQLEEFVDKAELNSSKVLAALCEMERKGILRHRPGKQFIKILR
jgi:predicted Rossmann fold nucleotide-binding protein DprA/Smf involved in DNA uptake